MRHQRGAAAGYRPPQHVEQQLGALSSSPHCASSTNRSAAASSRATRRACAARRTRAAVRLRTRDRGLGDTRDRRNTLQVRGTSARAARCPRASGGRPSSTRPADGDSPRPTMVSTALTGPLRVRTRARAAPPHRWCGPLVEETVHDRRLAHAGRAADADGDGAASARGVERFAKRPQLTFAADEGDGAVGRHECRRRSAALGRSRRPGSPRPTAAGPGRAGGGAMQSASRSLGAPSTHAEGRGGSIAFLSVRTSVIEPTKGGRRRAPRRASRRRCTNPTRAPALLRRRPARAPCSARYRRSRPRSTDDARSTSQSSVATPKSRITTRPSRVTRTLTA